jgi:hypothetical protein
MVATAIGPLIVDDIVTVDAVAVELEDVLERRSILDEIELDRLKAE